MRIFNADGTERIGSHSVSGVEAVGCGIGTMIAGRANQTDTSTAVITTNRLHGIPFFSPRRGGNVQNILIELTGAAVGNIVCGLYATSDSDRDINPSSKLAQGTAVSSGSTGVKTFTINYELTPGLIYWVAVNSSGGATVRTVPKTAVMPILGSSASNLSGVITHKYVASSYSSTMPSTFGTPTNGSSDIPAIGITFSS